VGGVAAITTMLGNGVDGIDNCHRRVSQTSGTFYQFFGKKSFLRMKQ
jgi:hypothetical protein